MGKWMIRILTCSISLGFLGGCAGMDTKKSADPSRKPARAARIGAVDEARKHFRAAEAAGGESAAPFEFYMAREYLVLAEKEFNAGDYVGVIDMAMESKTYSALVLERAGGGAK